MSGTAFTELVSDNEEFALKIELEDSLLWGHLVLYHQVNNGKIQLWHSEYHPTNGTEAFLDEVRMNTFPQRRKTQNVFRNPYPSKVICTIFSTHTMTCEHPIFR